MNSTQQPITNLLIKAIDNEHHLSLIQKNIQEYDDLITYISNIHIAIDNTHDISADHKAKYKTRFNQFLKETNQSKEQKKQKNDRKKYYVAIFDNQDEIVRVRRLYSQQRVQEVMEENLAFGYKVQQGYLGQSGKRLTWRGMKNHSNRNKKKETIYVNTNLII